jgi:predicted glycoside hydrolase/deacetylase ChbG (UPF0249 family)
MSPLHFDRARLIIVADDYGIRESAEPILQLARAGKVDRVAVLVNYVSDDEARELLGTSVKIDLHLELIRLVRSGEKVKEGAMTRGINFLFRYLFGIAGPVRVEREWRAQIERFREVFGRLPDGLNSHEHLHYFPHYFPVFLSLAREYGIPYVRFGRARVDPEFARALAARILDIFWRMDRKRLPDGDPGTSGRFVSYDWLEDADDIPRLLASGDTPVELAFHPERKEEYVVVERFL